MEAAGIALVLPEAAGAGLDETAPGDAVAVPGEAEGCAAAWVFISSCRSALFPDACLA